MRDLPWQWDTTGKQADHVPRMSRYGEQIRRSGAVTVSPDMSALHGQRTIAWGALQNLPRQWTSDSSGYDSGQYSARRGTWKNDPHSREGRGGNPRRPSR